MRKKLSVTFNSHVAMNKIKCDWFSDSGFSMGHLVVLWLYDLVRHVSVHEFVRFPPLLSTCRKGHILFFTISVLSLLFCIPVSKTRQVDSSPLFFSFQ